MTVFQTEDGVTVVVEAAVPTADDSSDLFDGNGAPTDVYNNSGANSTSYLKTNLGGLDHAEVSINVNDAALSSSNVGVQVADARSAEPSDFVNDEDFVDGSVIFTLVDEDGSGEIADDTDITSLEFQVTGYNT